MVIKRALFLSLFAFSLSCYLATGSQFPEACDNAAPSRCEGNELVICQGQIEFHIQCAEGSCTAGYQECGVCGDGTQQETEACDDGNQNNDDACVSCNLATCGDGFPQTNTEECDDGPNNSDTAPNACRLDCSLAHCGDNVLDAGEVCDDGNLIATDACTDECVVASCGDSIVQAVVEECDNGPANSDTTPNACRVNCKSPSCGDNIIDLGEVCDDGPNNSDTIPDSCRTSCSFASCGDGIVDIGESCDEGLNNSNTAPNACRKNCALPSCGDNIVDGGESCDDGPANSDSNPNACRTNCLLARCGDDVIDNNEFCDDGALNANNVPNACRTNCLLPRCGDGTIDTSEECDNANQNSNTTPDACRLDCVLPTCGDNTTDSNENCDNGAANSDTTADACRSTCVLASCGDGFTDSTEDCDNGSNNSDTTPNACRTTCQAAGCGDNIVDSGETCDDGDLDDNDSCRNTCVLAFCGDGVINADTETCDDGNQNNTDGCNTSCNLTNCGDGIVQGSEQCDNGIANSNSTPDACRTDCRIARCGDGVTDSSETCDDQNLNNQDNCLDTCLLAECGDGFVQTGAEQCDDANAIDGDGCDVDCGFTCGNGLLNFGSEECDDANANNLDGCDVTCSLAPKLQISVGGSHTCILNQAGEVFCFGEAQSGQLGYANALDQGDDEAIPTTPVSLGGAATQIVTGAEHSCALLQGGAVKCWGEASSGQLGYGNLNNIGDDETPNNAGAVNLEAPAIQIAAGANHTCALLDNGSVKCWGENTFGQLGAGNTQNIGDNEPVGAAVNVGALVTQIAAGAEHTCVVLANGAAKCWGNGTFGRLGYGDQVSIGDNEAPLATTLNFGVGRTVKALSLGGAHSCAILDNNDMRCWGLNASGELGNGDTQNIGDNEAPNFTSPINLGAVAVQISAGEKHTCALLQNGTVKCWGEASSGQLGYGNLNNIGDSEAVISVGTVSLGQPALQVSAGATHTCTILNDGTFRCFGAGLSGELGTGSVINNVGDNEAPSVAGAISIGAGVVASQIAVGASHTCIVTNTNKVLCWGANNFGQLGQGNKRVVGDDEAPQSVGFVSVLNGGESIVQIVAGQDHTCVLINPGGLVRCWGKGLSGRLGYANQNNVGDNETPLSVGNVNVGGVVDQIAAGAEHTCARIGNNVRCWGEGSLGRLGYGNTNDIGDNEAPAAAGNVPFSVNVLANNLGASGRHTCIIAAGTNNVRCWGANEFGQLGRGDTQNIGDNETAQNTIVVPGLANSDQLAPGTDHTCVLLDGTVRCFGRAAEGRLLTGNTNNILDQAGETASAPSIAGTASLVTSGEAHSCAISNGVLRCWGRNTFGQLGQGTTDTFGDNETSTPPPTQLGVTPLKVSAGQSHTCAISNGGAVFCWGFSGQGQLGYGGLQLLIGDDELPSARPAIAIP